MGCPIRVIENSGRGCPGHFKPQELEAVVQRELHQPASEEVAGNLAEVRAGDYLITGGEGRMIEHVRRVHAKLDALALGDLSNLGDFRIQVPDCGSGEVAALKRP